jgi:hypothetical protein
MTPLFLIAFSALISVSFPGSAQASCGPAPLTRRLLPPIDRKVIQEYKSVTHP